MNRQSADNAAKKAEKEAQEAAQKAEEALRKAEEARATVGVEKEKVSASSKVQEKAPASYPKPFNPEAPPDRAMLDVLRHNDSRAALKGPVSSQAAKTQALQKKRKEGGEKGSDSHRKCIEGWKQGRLWLEFKEVEVADLESEGCVLRVQAMFCKWCEKAGYDLTQRGKKQVWTYAGGGCKRLKLDSIKEHEITALHKEAANLLSNQSAMKEAVKTAILQEDRVLMMIH